MMANIQFIFIQFSGFKPCQFVHEKFVTMNTINFYIETMENFQYRLIQIPGFKNVSTRPLKIRPGKIHPAYIRPHKFAHFLIKISFELLIVCCN